MNNKRINKVLLSTALTCSLILEAVGMPWIDAAAAEMPSVEVEVEEQFEFLTEHEEDPGFEDETETRVETEIETKTENENVVESETNTETEGEKLVESETKSENNTGDVSEIEPDTGVEPEQELPEEESPEEESPEEEPSEQESSEQESPEQGSPEQESPEQESPEQEAPEQGSPEQESPEQESPEQESPEQEPPVQESMEQKEKMIENAEEQIETMDATAELKITQEPQDLTVQEGGKVTFQVAASGEGLTYQWWFMRSDMKTFTEWTGKTASRFSYAPTSKHNGMQCYVVVKDSAGYTVTSRTMILKVQSELKITQEPVDLSVKEGGKVTFQVAASGENLTYQWWFKRTDSKTFSIWSGKTAPKFSYVPTAKHDGMQVYCVVTDGTGKSVTSRTLTLQVKQELRLLQDLSDMTVKENDAALFEVKASGSGLSYVWYYKKANASKFSIWTGRNAARFSTVADASKDGMQVYCIIADSYGMLYKTSTITLTVLSQNPQPEPEVVHSTIKVLNTRPIYTGTTIYVEQELNGTTGEGIWADYNDGGSDLFGGSLPKDVRFREGCAYKAVIYSTPGVKKIYLRDENYKVISSVTVTVYDYDSAYKDWAEKTMAQVTENTDSALTKMEKLCEYVRTTMKYIRNDGTYLKILLDDIGVFWETGRIDCIDATYIMMDFAEMLGLPNEATYAGYSNHYYATVTIDGEKHIFDASPYSSTGIDNSEIVYVN